MPFGTANRFEQATLFDTKLSGVQDATKYGNICPQSELTATTYDGLGALSGFVDQIENLFLSQPVGRESEDCLKINVQMPKGTLPNASLPVAFFM
jgi:acetylcholinesterase